MSELRKVVLSGELGRKFGREHRFAVNTPAEAIRALCANFPDFHRHLAESDARGVGYRVVVRDRDTRLEQLHDPTGRAAIRIVPVVKGAAKGGLFEILAGVALIATAFITGGASIAASGLAFSGVAGHMAFTVGVALALGGVSQLLAPQPQAQTNKQLPSYSFSGPVNTTAQGGVVPVGYGRLMVGSVIGSAGIVVDQIPTTKTGPRNLTATVAYDEENAIWIVTATWDAAGQATAYDVTISGVGSLPRTSATSISGKVPHDGPWTVTVKTVEADGSSGPSASCVTGQSGQTDTSGGGAQWTMKGAIGQALSGHAPAHVSGASDFGRIVGYGGGGGKGGGGATIASDSLASRAYAQVLDIISEGEVEGLANGLQSVFLDGTPIMNKDGTFNFSGLSVTGNYGTPDQSYIPGFSDVENDVSVNVPVKQSTPEVRTITDKNVNSCRVIITFPQLQKTDTKTGDVSGTSVALAIDVSTDGVNWTEVVYDTVTGKASSTYQRSYLFPLPPLPVPLPANDDGWQIRVRRITPDSQKENIVDAFNWDSYVEIIDAKLSYRNTAVFGMRVDASQFQSVPARAYDMKLLRVQVPSNYDPDTRVYTGSWDGTFKVAWTDNPAWCFYDMLTHPRYGLGQYIDASKVDKWALYSIAKYCDELVPDGFGGQEPRFTCNLYLQTAESAFQVMQDMASIFRGMAYWASGSVTAVQDAPKDPVALFTNANVLNGDFAYSGSSLRARHTAALVSYNDPQNRYQPAVEYVQDEDGIARYGVVQTSVTALGCTSRGQAHRLGRWLLYSERLETEAVVFTAGLDGAGLAPGSIIKIADQVRAGQRLGGRISAASTTQITLDGPLPLGADGKTPIDATGATLNVVTLDGQVHTGTVASQQGQVLTLSADTALPSPPQPGAMWILETANVEAQLFRVIKATEGDAPDQYEITALAHNPSKYDFIEKDLALEARPVTSLPINVAPPPVVNISQTLYTYQSSVFVRATFSWPSQPGAIGYKVGYSAGGGPYVFANTDGTDFDLTHASADTYTVRVWSLGPAGGQSTTYTEATATLPGMNVPPADVADFTATIEANDILLTWRANADLNLAGYEIRQGESWDSPTTTVIQQNYQGSSLAVKAPALAVTTTTPLTYTYLIRALNTAEFYSPNVATATVTLVPPKAVQQFNVVQSGATLQFTWKANTDPGIQGYEIREGASWAASRHVATVSSTSYNMPCGAQGARTFWISAIAAPGIYGATPEFSTTAVALPSNRNMVMTQDEATTETGDHFPGIKINCAVNGSGALEMIHNQQRAEYLFDVNIPENIVTPVANSLFTQMDALQDDQTTWADETAIRWTDQAAQRAWAPEGDVKTVDFRYQFALPVGLAPTDVEGIRLDGALTPVGASTILEQQGVSWGDGRYGQGLVVTDLTRTKWSIAEGGVPQTFNLTFWWTPDQVTDCVIARLIDIDKDSELEVGHLELGYLAQTTALYLSDQAGQTVTLPFKFAAGDRLCLGVAQNSTTRKLFVSEMAGTAVMASENFTPIGRFAEFALY